MENFSDQRMQEDCPHCNPNSFALKHPLKESKTFWVVCDVHPLTEGHILIIPKLHLSCVGDYPDWVFEEFGKLFTKSTGFVNKEYRAVSTFEHGKIGQTVFHSHVHLLPWQGNPEDIIPEGKACLKPLDNLADLKMVFRQSGQYLFFSINKNLWVVDSKLGAPGFFRDRFSKVLGKPERGNWKQMRANKKIMAEANKDIENLKRKWQRCQI